MTLARCYWQQGNPGAARAELERALAGREAPEPYLRACLAAIEGPVVDVPPWAPTLAAAVRAANGESPDASALGKFEASLAIHSEAIRQNPRNAKVYFSRGQFYARSARFDEATADLVEAARLDPGDHFKWFHLASVRLYRGDVEGYRDSCREMLARFGQSREANVPERVAKVCLLGPGGGGDVRAASALADRAVELAPGLDRYALPWAQVVKGLAEYRSGRPEDAAAWLTKGYHAVDDIYCKTYAAAVLAMAYHRAGRPDVAQVWLDQVRDHVAKHLPRLEEGRLHDWLVCQILVREAQALIQDRAEKPSTQPVYPVAPTS